jgi:hypothetical protein
MSKQPKQTQVNSRLPQTIKSPPIRASKPESWQSDRLGRSFTTLYSITLSIWHCQKSQSTMEFPNKLTNDRQLWVEFNSMQKIVNYARVERCQTRSGFERKPWSESTLTLKLRHLRLKSTTTTKYTNQLSNSNITNITTRITTSYAT